jgi:hypothetical protein
VSTGPSELFTPVCSITTTKRGRFFWAAWWTRPPSHVPFFPPDASDGGAPTYEEARARAEKRAGRSLGIVDPEWARAVVRTLRGQDVWPSQASRAKTGPSTEVVDEAPPEPGSIWAELGIDRNATEAELKAAFRKRALEAHPDHGGTDEMFRRLLKAHHEAQKRLKRPRRKRPV